MRRRFSRGKFKKRSTAWVAGITSYDPVGGVDNRLITLGVVTGNVWGASIGLVIPGDLPIHGGEDAVLTRVVGRLGFIEGRRDAGAGFAATGFQIRVVIAQTDFLPAGTITPWDFTSSVGLGNDDIVWFHDALVPSVAKGAVGQGYENALGTMESWLEVDATAQRKVQEDRCIVVWFQTCLAAGTMQADFRLLGGLRTLLKRPV